MVVLVLTLPPTPGLTVHVCLRAGPATVCCFARAEKLKVGAAVIWRGSVLALLLCGPFTPNTATDDIVGRREVTAPTFLTFQLWQGMTASPQAAKLCNLRECVEPQLTSTPRLKLILKSESTESENPSFAFGLGQQAASNHYFIPIQLSDTRNRTDAMY